MMDGEANALDRRAKASGLGRKQCRSYRLRAKERHSGADATPDSILPSKKKDSGSARQGETANTETCDYPNRLNLTPLTAIVSGAFEKFCDFRKKSLSPRALRAQVRLARRPGGGRLRHEPPEGAT